MVACETIGCINVICSDKTGTLTENRMTVVDVWSGGQFRDVSSFSDENMLSNYCLNSTADLYEEEGNVRFVGNPTKGALLVSAKKCGVDYAARREGAQVCDLYPFSSDTKNMTVCVRTAEGYTVYTKGSPEKILALCSVGEPERLRIEEAIVGLQKRARRVLAFAHKEVKARPASREAAEEGMTFDGFVGIADPLRAEVKDAVHACKTANIEVKMLTGDNIITATAIADELGLLEGGGIAVEASYLEGLSDEEFSKVLPSVRVIARSTPLLKMRVVKELKSKGNVVAVTGDRHQRRPRAEKRRRRHRDGHLGHRSFQRGGGYRAAERLLLHHRHHRQVGQGHLRKLQAFHTISAHGERGVCSHRVPLYDHRAVRGGLPFSLLRARSSVDQHHHGRPSRAHAGA